MRASEFVSETWSEKYKRSINCANPKGFSQRAHCAGRKKNEDLNEFAPGGNSASSYYAVTENFIDEFTQQKQEELQHLLDAGWTKQDLAQAGTLAGQAADIAHFEQVRDGFLKGLKPGFDAYLRGDTQLKDQLGAYWMENDLPLNQDWEKIYGEPWGDDGLDEALNEFAPASNPGGGNYLKALASAWYNGTFNTGDLHKGIKSQEDVERILERGIHCGDGRVRKYSIGYNANFDGVEIQSDDHYEYSDYDDAGNDIDSRTGKPWGPYDVVAFSGNELDESQLNEFAPSSDDNRENSPEDVLFRFAKMWYSAPDVATQQRVEQALAKIGWEIGELESEEGGAFVMQIGDEDGNSYLAWSEEQLADQLNELTFLGSQCTKDCSGHRAGYAWSQRKGGMDSASWSPSFNKGAWLHNNGF